MKKYNIHNGYLWRISGGRYPTLYLLDCEDKNPMKIKKEIRMPILPKFARSDENVVDALIEAERLILIN